MPLVMNATSKEVVVQAHGAWFTFAPNQIKDMHEDKVAFLTSNKAYLGFVGLPEELADLDTRNSAKGKEIIAAKKAEGVSNRIRHLELVRDNELISLKRDLDQKNITGDVRAYMSEGAINAMQELVTYKKANADVNEKKVEKIKELEAALLADSEA